MRSVDNEIASSMNSGLTETKQKRKQREQAVLCACKSSKAWHFIIPDTVLQNKIFFKDLSQVLESKLYFIYKCARKVLLLLLLLLLDCSFQCVLQREDCRTVRKVLHNCGQFLCQPNSSSDPSKTRWQLEQSRAW